MHDEFDSFIEEILTEDQIILLLDKANFKFPKRGVNEYILRQIFFIPLQMIRDRVRDYCIAAVQRDQPLI